VRALEHLHKHLYGKEFHLHTNHSTLTWLMSFKNLEGQTVGLSQHFQEYRVRNTIMPMPAPEDLAEKSVFTVKKPKRGQKSSRCELLRP
jgi:hypothetical protein